MAHKFWALTQSRFVPNTPVVVHIVFTVILPAYTWSAAMPVGREKGMNP